MQPTDSPRVQKSFPARASVHADPAHGGTPDLHIVDMNDPDWTAQVLDLTDGVGPDKIADFTSEQEVLNTELDLVRHDGVLYIQENLRNPDRVLHVDPYAAIAEKNLRIMGTIDSRRIDRPGIIRTLRNKEVQRMWDVVVTHEFPMTEAEQAFKISASQRCAAGKSCSTRTAFRACKEVTDG